MPGPKTNEREGARAVLRYAGVSAFKVRQVIDAIRGRPVHEAADLLRFIERDAAELVEKVLASAVANASNNDGLDPEELYVSACFVDEGPTAKRWRPRARGRATRIRKRSCHVTVIVSRMPEAQLNRLRARRQVENLAMRARRVEATRRARAESAEGTSRRQRRHPGAFPAPEEERADTEAGPGTDAGPEAGAETDAEVAAADEPELAAADEPELAAGDGAEVEASGDEAEVEASPGQAAGDPGATGASGDKAPGASGADEEKES
jgi:large subunit ribosomal protein L22